MSKTGKTIIWVVVALVVLIGAAIAIAVATFKQPEVPFTYTYFQAHEKQDPNATTTLAVYNPNHYPLHINDLEYIVTIDGYEIFTGKNKDKIKLKARDTTNLDLPYKFNADVYAAKLNNQDSGLFVYHIDAKAGAAFVKDIALNIEKEEKRPLLRMFTAEVNDFEITDFNLKEPEIVIETTIKNPNVQSFNMSGTYYSFYVGEKKWGEGNVPGNFTIKAKNSHQLNIPVKIDLSEVKESAKEYLKNQEDKQYTLDIRVNGETTDGQIPPSVVDIHKTGKFRLKEMVKKELKKDKED